MSETTNQTSTIPNRQQRRLGMKHQGLLKMKSKLSFKQWLDICKQTREKGKEIHEANVEAADKAIYAKYEEIEKLREAYASIMIKDKENWHRDKKIARKTIKDLRTKLYKRKS